MMRGYEGESLARHSAVAPGPPCAGGRGQGGVVGLAPGSQVSPGYFDKSHSSSLT